MQEPTMLVKTLLAHRLLVRLIPAAFLGLFVVAFVFTYVKFIPRRRSFSFDNLPLCDADAEPASVFDSDASTTASGGRGHIRNFTVVLWTSYFNTRNHRSFDESPLDPKRCSFTNCAFVTDRDRVDDADAVVFHEADMSLADMPTRRRTSRQRWVMFNQESPPNSVTLSPAYNGIFNWSMTYSRTADVVVPYFETCRQPNVTDGLGGYGTDDNNRNNNINEEDEVENNENDLSPTEEGRGGAGGGKKAWAAVWFVSNCRGPSNRMAYVEELQNYIIVDIIGACSPHNIQCPKANHKVCLDTFLPKYKFVLAFENSICADYVTEKLRNVLPYDVVPIFWGGVDYGAYLPRESFVVASDYPNPKDLARALYRFRSDELFRRTVAYRRGVLARPVDWKCRLCAKLNASGNETSVRHNLYQATHRSGRCKVWRRGHFLEQFPPR